MTAATELDDAVAAHDAAVAARGLDVWVGNEPTFTDRWSSAGEWVTQALGREKETRARDIVAAIARDHPGCAVIRSLGRQYPGEDAPRWSFGVYARRDGSSIWPGPPDPLLAATLTPGEPSALQGHLAVALAKRGFSHRAFSSPADARVLFARDPAIALPDPVDAERLLRPSIHIAPVPPGGVHDELAGGGLFLLIVSSVDERGVAVPCVELPALGDVGLFVDVLRAIAEAAYGCGLTSLILRGFAPPVDESVAHATVTPDPAVVEVNMAPHRSVLSFLQDNRRCYAAAAAVGLSPYRLHFNGAVADSGGGGQMTFGGPSALRSPFLLVPHLLPRLIRYAVRHPALSYLFAHDYVGPSGQSVRADELHVDALGELKLALSLLDGRAQLDPTTLWGSLAPSLTDSVGNGHRAEINIEKLWNPHQPGRGQLGLVEWRAFRMQHTPERAAALAALLRAVLAMLMTRDDRANLVDWGTALHDRFALPFYLEADLREVLVDLDAGGMGLEPPIVTELETDLCRPWHTIEFRGCTLAIRRGLEFWSLLGDASQQLGTSRLVDASTSRVEVALRPTACADTAALGAWRLRAENIELPLRAESDAHGPVRLFGVRYRSFVPAAGLHPTLGARDPVRLLLSSPAQPEALEVSLHEWRPDGGPYDGPPADLAQAAARRAARCVALTLPASDVPPAREAPRGAGSAYCLDLRYG